MAVKKLIQGQPKLNDLSQYNFLDDEINFNIAKTREVFPDPDSPTTPKLSPWLISKEIPLTAWTILSYCLKLIFKFLTLTILIWKKYAP